jgi:hypothetical protein
MLPSIETITANAGINEMSRDGEQTDEGMTSSHIKELI